MMKSNRIKTVLVIALLVITGLASNVAAGEMMIVAHRGASRDAPQNTIPAFKLAWQQGADAIEADFHLTKDGHIVCIHDGNTKPSIRKAIAAQTPRSL
jgi:glycerophosphoryl diester phosphodiesterase